MEKKIIDFTKKIIKYKTTEDNIEEIEKCLDFFQNKFERNFLIKKYYFREKPILVLSNTKDKNLDFVLAGHIDVVPGEEDQFELTEDENKIFGRGVFDMKGQLVPSLLAVNDFIKNNNFKIGVFITPDEEKDGLSVRYLLNEIGYKSKFALLPDGGSGKEIITHQKGFWQIKLTIDGRSAHGARPWEADNPIKKGMLLYSKLLREFPDPKNRLDWKTSVNLTKISSNNELNAINQVSDKVVMYFDIRYINEKDKIKIEKIINKFLKDKFDLEVLAGNGLLSVDKNNEYLKKLKRSIFEVTGKKINLSKEAATSDAIFFSEQNIPAVLFRSQGGGQHQDNEWADKKTLFKLHDIVLSFLQKFND